MKKGRLTISRIYSTDDSRNNTIAIHIEDDDYKEVCKVEVKPEDFCNALTGLSCVKCEIKSAFEH